MNSNGLGPTRSPTLDSEATAWRLIACTPRRGYDLTVPPRRGRGAQRHMYQRTGTGCSPGRHRARLYAPSVEPEIATRELETFAATYATTELAVRRAAVALDERQDGEPVTRVLLLLNEPDGETWDVDSVRELRHVLGRKATEFGLPSVSITLVPESEAKIVDAFAQ